MSRGAAVRSILTSSLYLGALCAVVQPVPHQFTDLTILPDRSVALSLDGSVTNLFNLRGSPAARQEPTPSQMRCRTPVLALKLLFVSE